MIGHLHRERKATGIRWRAANQTGGTVQIQARRQTVADDAPSIGRSAAAAKQRQIVRGARRAGWQDITGRNGRSCPQRIPQHKHVVLPGAIPPYHEALGLTHQIEVKTIRRHPVSQVILRPAKQVRRKDSACGRIDLHQDRIRTTCALTAGITHGEQPTAHQNNTRQEIRIRPARRRPPQHVPQLVILHDQVIFSARYARRVHVPDCIYRVARSHRRVECAKVIRVAPPRQQIQVRIVLPNCRPVVRIFKLPARRANEINIAVEKRHAVGA